jgi:para-nitrobenzyl esterase
VASLEEDSLCLNVTTPRAADPQRRRPVMVWIHGDGAVGAGSFFDARRLTTIGDVVVVTINYRLSIFGAFGHPGWRDQGPSACKTSKRRCGGWRAMPPRSVVTPAT